MKLTRKVLAIVLVVSLALSTFQVVLANSVEESINPTVIRLTIDGNERYLPLINVFRDVGFTVNFDVVNGQATITRDYFTK